jgi:tetratricopeptide (TPR) repeat protein
MTKLLAISALFFTLYSQAQTDKARIDTIKALMKRQQYLSAYKMMQTVQNDGQELIPLAVILVTSHSIGHNDLYDKWGFKDVNPSGPEAKESVEFPVERLLAYGIQQFPKDCAMYFSSARYYSWMINQEKRYMALESLQEIRDYFVQKTPADCHDEGYYYVVGYANSYLGKPTEAAQQLRQAVSLNPQMTTGWIELANAYVQLKDPAKAIEAGKTVWGMTKDRGLLAQASRIMGEAYELQNDNANALFRYSQADTLHRAEFFNQLSLLKFMIKTNNAGAPKALNAFIGGQGRESLHFYMDAFEVYKQYNKLSELAQFCEKYMQDWKERQNIVACTNFTLGLIYKTSNPARAKEHFRKAKELGITADRYRATRNHPVTKKAVEEAFAWIN